MPAKTRRRRDPAKEKHWRRIIRRHQDSGLSVRAFCEREGLKDFNFLRWRRELNQRDREKNIVIPNSSARNPPRNCHPELVGKESTAHFSLARLPPGASSRCRCRTSSTLASNRDRASDRCNALLGLDQYDSQRILTNFNADAEGVDTGQVTDRLLQAVPESSYGEPGAADGVSSARRTPARSK